MPGMKIQGTERVQSARGGSWGGGGGVLKREGQKVIEEGWEVR